VLLLRCRVASVPISLSREFRLVVKYVSYNSCNISYNYNSYNISRDYNSYNIFYNYNCRNIWTEVTWLRVVDVSLISYPYGN
jgi:hypothetical protein